MAARNSKTNKAEIQPMIIKAYSTNCDKLLKETLHDGKIEEFVAVPGVNVKEMCSSDNDVIFVFQNKADKTKGGVVVLDPVTKVIKQQIDTWPVLSCRIDNGYLVVGGFRNGIVYVFKHEDRQFTLMNTKKLHGNSTVWGVAVQANINAIVSVGGDKKAIVSHLTEDNDHKKISLRSEGNCVVINEPSTAIIGCDDGLIVTIDIVKMVVKSTLKCHGGLRVNSIDICSQRNLLISGGEDGQIICWKIQQPTLTEVWNCKFDSWVTSLCVRGDRVFANILHLSTVAIDIPTGKVVRKYSKTGSDEGYASYGLAVVSQIVPASITDQMERNKIQKMAPMIKSEDESNDEDENYEKQSPPHIPGFENNSFNERVASTTTTSTPPAYIKVEIPSPTTTIASSAPKPTKRTAVQSTDNVEVSTPKSNAKRAKNITQPPIAKPPTAKVPKPVKSEEEEQEEQEGDEDEDYVKKEHDEDEFAHLEAENIQLKADIAIARQNLIQLQNDCHNTISQLQATINEHHVEVAQIQSNHAKVVEQFEAQIEADKATINELQSAHLNCEQNIADLRARVVELETSIQSYKHSKALAKEEDLIVITPDDELPTPPPSSTKRYLNPHVVGEDVTPKQVATKGTRQLNNSHRSNSFTPIASSPSSSASSVLDWDFAAVSRWMRALSLHTNIKSALEGMTGAELLMLNDDQALAELNLNKIQLNRLRSALADLGIRQ